MKWIGGCGSWAQHGITIKGGSEVSVERCAQYCYDTPLCEDFYRQSGDGQCFLAKAGCLKDSSPFRGYHLQRNFSHFDAKSSFSH